MKTNLLRSCLLLLIYLFSFYISSAQWVSIPDTNFGTWLNTNGYAACMQGNNSVGWQMDTSCPAVVGATKIYCSNSRIQNLTGIEYFNNLDTLYCCLDSLYFLSSLPRRLRLWSCYGNQLSSLPPLPDSLKVLICYSNPLIFLPPLPDSLTELQCNNSLLTALPALPGGLTILKCNDNQLTTLPTLPASLVELYCYGNQLTSLPTLPDSLTFLFCSGNNLSSLPALPTKLKILKCYGDQLTSLPALPDSLTYLDCSNNSLSSLPALPDSLTRLDCSGNSLSSLPALPDSLAYLYCYRNNLTSLPTLPNALILLYCSYNNLALLPALPDSLTELYCSYNQLSNLPALPVTLYYLYCDSNQLTTLPSLPNSLTILNCNYNNLASVPALPSGLNDLLCSVNQLTWLPGLPWSLHGLTCAHNNLTLLPALPTGLTYLDCSANQLTSLSALPGMLSFLHCDHNQLNSVSELPDSLYQFFCNDNPNLHCLPELRKIRDFRFDNTGISCLPNYPQYNYFSSPSLGSVPLCGIFNNSGCPVYWNIAGKTYYDANNDCLQNFNDTTLRNVKVQLWNSGNLVQQFYTGGEGLYSFDTDFWGYYDSNIDTAATPFYVSCPANNLLRDTIIAVDSLEYSKDFALRCKTGFDLAAQSICSPCFRPGRSSFVFISAGDFSNFYNGHCASGVSGAVTVTITGATHYVSPLGGSLTPTVSGNVLTYNIADFGSVNFFTDFNFIGVTDTTAPLNSQVCFTVTVTPTTGDYNIANNTLTHCYTVIGSFDPNSKEVYPRGDLDARGNRWLTYTINFQNTGTDTAFDIYIADTLDANLDVSTFQLLAYSYPVMVQIKGNAVRFNFANINLVDSNTNEPLSHGYVQYKIKINESAPTGIAISNTAYIYFDFNSPVVTNTTVNELICVPDTFNLAADICDNETYPFNGALLNASGVYYGTFGDRYGCDSTIKFKLAVYGTSGNEVANICDNETFDFNGSPLNAAGIYFDTLSNVIGCDSVIMLTLAVHVTSGNVKVASICDNDIFYFHGVQLNSSGVYYDTLSNLNGCDSLVMLSLHVLPTSYSTVNDIIFQGYTYTLPSGRIVTQPGTYVDTLVASNNCDSVITTNLNMVSSAPSAGSTQLFTIHPNPSNGSITISIDESMIGSSAVIVDIAGRKMASVQLQTSNTKLQTENFSSGVYFVTVSNERGSVTKKLIINK